MEETAGTNGTSHDEAEKEAPEKPMQLEETDRLRIENAQLKLMNLVHNKQSAMRAMAQIDEDLERAQVSYVAIQKEVVDKYKIDLAVSEIEASSGKIVPKGSTRRGSIR